MASDTEFKIKYAIWKLSAFIFASLSIILLIAFIIAVYTIKSFPITVDDVQIKKQLKNAYPNYSAVVLKQTDDKILGEIQGFDHYSVLHVHKDATKNEIQDSFYKIAKMYHPNNNYSDNEIIITHDNKLFIRLAQAYDTLGNSMHRALYDLQLQQTPCTCVYTFAQYILLFFDLQQISMNQQ